MSDCTKIDTIACTEVESQFSHTFSNRSDIPEISRFNAIKPGINPISEAFVSNRVKPFGVWLASILCVKEPQFSRQCMTH